MWLRENDERCSLKTMRYLLAGLLGLIVLLAPYQLRADTTYSITDTLATCISGPCPTPLDFSSTSTITLDASLNVISANISIGGINFTTTPNCTNGNEFAWCANFPANPAYQFILFDPSAAILGVPQSFDLFVNNPVVSTEQGLYTLAAVTSAPEPGTSLLLVSGLVGLLAISFRRKLIAPASA